MPQRQPSVHEGHEGKSHDDFENYYDRANDDVFANDSIIAMITKPFTSPNSFQRWGQGKDCQHSWKGMRKRQISKIKNAF